MTRLAFSADWCDPAHDYVYKFTLVYYPDDGDVELVRWREKDVSFDFGFQFLTSDDKRNDDTDDDAH